MSRMLTLESMATRTRSDGERPEGPGAPEGEPLSRMPAQPRLPRQHARASPQGESRQGTTARGFERDGRPALVIVESPTKAKTIGKYLGSGYDVRATVGHLRDLPTRELGVDVENGFEPKYVTIKGKTKTLAELKKAAKAASTIYLATDPDREGEAIAWHVADQLRLPASRPTACCSTRSPRTPSRRRCEDPGEIDDRKVDAQQARRILDRLVGYKASPILWRSIKTGLSAGRVQTVALRLIVEREREIRAFKPQEYWTIEALLRQGRPDLRGRARQGRTATSRSSTRRGRRPRRGGRGAAAAVRRHQGREAEPAEESRRAVHHQHAAAGGRQEARLPLAAHHARGAGSLRGHRRRRGRAGRSHHLHANRLVRVSDTAIAAVRELHRQELRQGVPARRSPTPTAPKKNARCRTPTRPSGPPTSAGGPSRSAYLEPDQFRLYQLIWQRFVASQMTPAVYDMTIVDFDLGRVPVPGHRLGARVRRLPRALHRGPGEGGGQDDGRSPAHPAARAGRPGRGPGDHARRSTSPSRRRASPRPAW